MSDIKKLFEIHWDYVIPFGIVLFLSLCLNIVCCALRCCSGRGGKGRKRQRVRESQRQMEENPIYGNLGYMQTSQVSFTEVDPPPSRKQGRVTSDSQQAKAQDCYANLSLKPPATQSGRNSPQVQYSDVVHLDTTGQPAREVEREEVEEAEGGHGEEADSTDVMSTVSDLYASVQTQRTKTIDPAVEGDAYANQL